MKSMELFGFIIKEFVGWKSGNGGSLSLVSDDEIILESKKYKYRSDWKLGANRHYQEVHKRRKHLVPICTAHMELSGPYEGHQVYAYEFEDKTVYVGLTGNPTRRHKTHLETGPVSERLHLRYELKVLASGLTKQAAHDHETAEHDKYAAAGWTNLSTRERCGAMGRNRQHTRSTCLDVARTCATKKAFHATPQGQAAILRGWNDEIAQEMGWPDHVSHVWTQEKCEASAKRFTWLVDWINGDSAAYTAAKKRGWLAAIKTRMFPRVKPTPKKTWTYGECLTSAKTFDSVSRWQYAPKTGSYVAARKNGWLAAIRAACWPGKIHRGPKII